VKIWGGSKASEFFRVCRVREGVAHVGKAQPLQHDVGKIEAHISGIQAQEYSESDRCLHRAVSRFQHYFFLRPRQYYRNRCSSFNATLPSTVKRRSSLAQSPDIFSYYYIPFLGLCSIRHHVCHYPTKYGPSPAEHNVRCSSHREVGPLLIHI
jgi:hypothetical protein